MMAAALALAVASPLPVHVVNFPDPDKAAEAVAQATLAVSKYTLWVALAAVLVAVVTLLRVNRQIKLATDQLELAREELKAVKEDLKESQEMKAFTVRVPSLKLHIEAASESMQVIPRPVAATAWSTRHYREVQFSLNVKNEGQRVSREVELSVLIPEADCCAEVVNPNWERRWEGGKTYFLQEFGVIRGDIKIRAGLDYHTGFTVAFKASITRTQLLWHIFDDEYAYPSAEWAAIEIDFKMPPMQAGS